MKVEWKPGQEKLRNKNIAMRNIAVVFGIVMTLFFWSCKDSKSTEEVTIISPQEVREAVYDSNSHQLIDVRTIAEFDEGHLKRAQNICVTDADFKENVAKLDKTQPVYVYCRSGKRSAKAAEILKEMGFKEIYDMEGGFLRWEDENMEIEK